MFSRNFVKRFAIVVGIVAALMLAVTPVAEANRPIDTAESTLDEPRSMPTVKPHGPYRLILPTPSRATDKIVSEVEPPQTTPHWTNGIYKIRLGDVLSKLSEPLGVSVAKLASCSGISNPDRIAIGYKLRKPGNCVAAPKPVKTTKTTKTPTPPVSRVSGIAGTVIAFAKAQLGDPYVWGGNGPNSWDCSGLVHAAFASAGISISRQTGSLINEGVAVGRGSLVAGDLVFPSSGHVGIYVGGGNMIHAPEPGDVVKISPIWSFYAGRRIV